MDVPAIRKPKGFVTVQQHIIEDQKAFPTATGEFTWLMSGITLATKIIADQVRRAGLLDITGAAGHHNIQGEAVQKLDQLSNDVLLECLGYRETVALLVSEEEDVPRAIQHHQDKAKYIVLFDPVDGSSNIDVNVAIGTIFSILRKRDDIADPASPEHCLQPGHQQVAAGYVMYSGSTVMVYSTGQGVHVATLDPAIGAFILHDEHLRMPADGKIYSLNEAYLLDFPEPVQRYLAWTKQNKYSSRYVGSLIADFHRTLLRGGVFLYPPTPKSPRGKLRLLYEANPLAFLAEQAGGVASDGHQRILDIVPTRLHERTSLVLGSRDEVQRVLAFGSF